MLMADASLKAADSQQRLIADVNEIESANEDALALNQRITPILTTAVDAPDLKNDEDAWKTWWYEHLGYRYDPPASGRTGRERLAPVRAGANL